MKADIEGSHCTICFLMGLASEGREKYDGPPIERIPGKLRPVDENGFWTSEQVVLAGVGNE
jgi:hypothetical protein